jgi:hypothetical protein
MLCSGDVSPVKYELGYHIPEDDILQIPIDLTFSKTAAEN